MSILSLIREILNHVVVILRDFATSQDNKKTFKGEIMYIVKADNPDVGFNIAFDATDSEGNFVPEDNLTVDVTSDNEDAVSVSADDSGLAGTIHFGNPGLANLNVTVKNGEDMLGSFGAQFTVTVGDPAAIAGGTISFDGLEEASDLPAEETEVPAEEEPVTETPTGEPLPEVPSEEPSETPTEELPSVEPVEEAPSDENASVFDENDMEDENA